MTDSFRYLDNLRKFQESLREEPALTEAEQAVADVMRAEIANEGVITTADSESFDRTVRAIVAAAMPPWVIEPDEHGIRVGTQFHWVGQCPDCGTTAEFEPDEADLIANAPSDLAYLLERNALLEGQLAKARERHKPVHRFTNPEGECSFDNEEEASDWFDLPVEQLSFFDICASCGEMEMAEGCEHDYKESLWPCPEAVALGLDGGGSDA